MTATVHTYFEPVPGIDEPGQRREIDVWRTSWERQGWTTRVLSYADVVATPEGAFTAEGLRKKRMPSVNPPGYDLQCFLRWIALVSVGGGLMTDYDTVNMGYTPAEHSERIAGRDLVEFCAYRTPAMLYVTEAKAFKIVRLLVMYVPDGQDVVAGRPHVSDMTILKRSPFGYTLTPDEAICQELDQRRPGCKVLHASHHAVRSLPAPWSRCPRWFVMASLLDGLLDGRI